MGKRTVEIRFCDSCNKEIVGRLTVYTCPVCHADICVECQEKEDAKHKPRERKTKTSTPPPEDTGGISTNPDLFDLISTFQIRTLYPDGKEGQPSRLSMGDVAVVNKSLKAGIIELLGLTDLTFDDVGAVPDSEGKRNLFYLASVCVQAYT